MTTVGSIQSFVTAFMWTLLESKKHHLLIYELIYGSTAKVLLQGTMQMYRRRYMLFFR